MLAALQNWFFSEAPKPAQSESSKSLKKAVMYIRDPESPPSETLPEGVLDDQISRVDDFVQNSLPEIPNWMTLRLSDRFWGRDILFTHGKVYWVFDAEKDYVKKGFFKTAHLAIDLFSHKVVVLLTSKKKEELRDSAFLQELAPHPHIAECYGSGKMPLSPNIFMIMPFYPKGDLQMFVTAHIKNGGLTLSVKQRLDIARQIASGLSHIHARGILHRDLKLENLLIDEKGNIAFADFGLAVHVKKPEEIIKIAGTGSEHYFPPEVCKILRDTQSSKEDKIQMICDQSHDSLDIWAFGCILHLLFLKGMRPAPWFGKENALVQIANLKEGWQPRREEFIYPEIQPLINTMLAVDPLARPNAACVEKQLRDHALVLETRALLKIIQPHLIEPLPLPPVEKQKRLIPIANAKPIDIPHRVKGTFRHRYLG